MDASCGHKLLKQVVIKAFMSKNSSLGAYPIAWIRFGTPIILIIRRRLYARQNKLISASTLAKPFNKK